jgi:glucans biosynthesis protein
MGASYFRTSGPFNQYGLSARGIAIDTAMPRPEEFPRFSQFWLQGAIEPNGPMTIYALLEGPSITGAYRMGTKRSVNAEGVARIDMDIEARLFARQDIDRIGIAPFSSMFWYGETNRKQAADWRPEIHDSDGLAILTGAGERIWRPLANPPRVMTSTFVDHDMKGFGLLQRDRHFDHYLDDGVFYEKRPSTWVEPLEPWGEGAVQLVEIPTDDETSDNIVAYWKPKDQFRSGQKGTWRYRLSWLDDIAFPDYLAHTIGTWSGVGGRPGPSHDRPAGVEKFVIDFKGKPFKGLGRDDGVELIVNASRGVLSNVDNHPVVGQEERWRAFFDIKATGSEPVDLRAYLRKGSRALTETWIYQYFPSET